MSETRPEKTPRVSRRALLGGTAAVAASTAFGVRRVMAGPEGWDEVTPFLTDASVFYDRFEAKKFDPIFWYFRVARAKDYPTGHEPAGRLSLAIEGAVDSPANWTEGELRERFAAGERVSILKTMQCTGDGPGMRLASNGVWSGIPLQDLLGEAGVRGSAVRIHVYGDDGFTAGLRLSDLNRPDGRRALLALELNGKPLPVERGGPFRLLIPNKFGFKNVKWPRRLVLSEDDVPFGNHETVIEGGTDDGDRRVGAKILSPSFHRRRRLVRTDVRERVLRGVAFGGTAPVHEVRISIGGGEWQTCTLDRPEELASHPDARDAHAALRGQWPLPDVWVPWSFSWTPPGRGDYEVWVHAENQNGETTPEFDDENLDGDSSMARGTIRVT